MPIRKSYRKRRSYKKKLPVTKAVKKYVKREIHRNVENKVQHVKYAQADIATVITDAQVIPLGPVIARGTGEGDRIGNEIRIRKAILNIQGYLLDTSISPDIPKVVSIYLFKCRPQNFPTVGNMQGFLQDGNSAVQYQGRITDFMKPINSDLFILRKQINKIHVTGYTATNPIGSNLYTNNFMYKLDVTKYFKKRLLFNDGSTNTITNDNLNISVGACYTTNIDFPPGTEVLGKYNVFMTFEYEDA